MADLECIQDTQAFVTAQEVQAATERLAAGFTVRVATPRGVTVLAPKFGG
jgi:hypothetical protein